MRLTLRTLLAYMDDLLEPQDAIQMGKRIEENKVATELVHRIRTRMRLLRLGAPKVEGKGLGADANSVAEYLDNSLAPERVPDFEKLCLESDVHLAEAASCHQILAAVMDKPAAVDPALRLRVYSLIARADDFSVGSSAVLDERENLGREPNPSRADFGDLATLKASTAFAPLGVHDSEIAGLPPAGGAPVAAAPRKKAIPHQVVLAATAALVLLLVLGGLRLAGPFDGRHPLAGLLGIAAPNGDSGQLVAMDAGSDTGNSAADATADAGTGPAPAAGDTAAGDTAAGDSTAGDSGAGGNAAGGEPSSGGSASPEGGLPAAGSVAGAGAGKADNPVSGAPSPNGDATGVPAAGAAGVNTGVAAGPSRATDEPLAAAGPKPVGVAAPTEELPGEEPVRDVGGTEIGRLLSEEQLVAHRNADDDLWYRVPRGASIMAGDHLVSLPFFRPQFILSTGVQFMTAGEASLRFGVAAGGQTPTLEVETGRLLVATSGRPGASIRLNLGGQKGILRFIDVDAEAAIEVRREFIPGDDPMVTAAPTTIAIAVRRGKVGWLDPMNGGRSETIIGSGMFAVFAPGMELQIEDRPFPAWSSPPASGGLERSAAEQLVGLVKADRPLTLSLSELTQFRRTEVRSLAARCLGALGSYQALWKELADERQYSYWDEALDAIRSAIVRSPQDALDVRRSAEQLMKQDVALLMQLIRGYDPSQLENGGAAEVVDALDHGDLEVRVLAFENLRRITGATHNYRPEKPAEARKASTLEWGRQLRDGRIVYRQRAPSAE